MKPKFNPRSMTHISNQKPQHLKYRRPCTTQGINYRRRASSQILPFLHHLAHQVSKSCCLASFGTVGSFGSSISPFITQGISYRWRDISQIRPCITQGISYRWRASSQGWTFRHHSTHQVSKSCCSPRFCHAPHAMCITHPGPTSGHVRK